MLILYGEYREAAGRLGMGALGGRSPPNKGRIRFIPDIYIYIGIYKYKFAYIGRYTKYIVYIMIFLLYIMYIIIYYCILLYIIAYYIVE